MAEKRQIVCKDCGEVIRPERGYYVHDPNRGEEGPFCLSCMQKKEGRNWVPPDGKPK